MNVFALTRLLIYKEESCKTPSKFFRNLLELSPSPLSLQTLLQSNAIQIHFHKYFAGVNDGTEIVYSCIAITAAKQNPFFLSKLALLKCCVMGHCWILQLRTTEIAEEFKIDEDDDRPSYKCTQNIWNTMTKLLSKREKIGKRIMRNQVPSGVWEKQKYIINVWFLFFWNLEIQVGEKERGREKF